MSLTTAQMAGALARNSDPFKNHVFPNLFLPGGWEADLFVLRPSGFADEIEIKVSRADFKAEFREKAFKHEWLVSGIPTATHPSPYWPSGPATGGCVKEAALGRLTLGLPFHPHVVRRYWMAFPEELAAKLAPEVPPHAGILSVAEQDRRDRVTIVRSAPVLRQVRKSTDEERVAYFRGVYFRFWKLRADAGMAERMFADLDEPRVAA